MPWLKIWALLKLNRFAEAEAAIAACEQLGGHGVKAGNSRGTLASRRRQREAHFDVPADDKAESMVILRNEGSAAINDFRFDDGEKLLLKATTLGERDYNGTPWLDLTNLYLQQARFTDAVAAFKKAQVHRSQRELHTLQADAGRCDMSLAHLLIVANRMTAAERLARRACDQPDRTGHSSEAAVTHSVGQILLLWTIVEARLEELNEEAVLAPWTQRLWPDAARQQLKYEAWTLQRRLRTLLSGEMVVDALRPNIVGVEESWILAGLMQVLPPGEAVEAVRGVQAADDHPLAAGYFAELAAEAALAGGRTAEAQQYAAAAIEKLPAAEQLLVTRAKAVAAEAALRRGDTAGALASLDQVLVMFPGALRLLKTAVPVHIEHDGSPLAERVAAMLLRSPRLRSDTAGFPISIKCQDGSVQLEMLRLNQVSHLKQSISVDEDEEKTIATVYRKFHQRLLSPALELSEVEINDLDESPSAMQSRNRVERLMQDIRPKR
jgi:tetratricopeptide (TPR) repeat protein